VWYGNMEFCTADGTEWLACHTISASIEFLFVCFTDNGTSMNDQNTETVEQ